jgi:hypothetical protein
LCGFCKCSHINQYAALSKTPHALADGLMLVFKHPDETCLRSHPHPGVPPNYRLTGTGAWCMGYCLFIVSISNQLY